MSQWTWENNIQLFKQNSTNLCNAFKCNSEKHWFILKASEESCDKCVSVTLTMGTYSSGGAGWILLDISITALTSPVTFSYTLSLERSRLAVGGGLISWGCSWTVREQDAVSHRLREHTKTHMSDGGLGPWEWSTENKVRRCWWKWWAFLYQNSCFNYC